MLCYPRARDQPTTAYPNSGMAKSRPLLPLLPRRGLPQKQRQKEAHTVEKPSTPFHRMSCILLLFAATVGLQHAWRTMPPRGKALRFTLCAHKSKALCIIYFNHDAKSPNLMPISYHKRARLSIQVNRSSTDVGSSFFSPCTRHFFGSILRAHRRIYIDNFHKQSR